MAVPLAEYEQLMARLPAGEARRKLEGVLTWHEIEINLGHADELLPALRGISAASGSADAETLEALIRSLEAMRVEPALYLMLRVRS
jgi:hypothetical protein